MVVRSVTIDMLLAHGREAVVRFTSSGDKWRVEMIVAGESKKIEIDRRDVKPCATIAERLVKENFDGQPRPKRLGVKPGLKGKFITPQLVGVKYFPLA